MLWVDTAIAKRRAAFPGATQATEIDRERGREPGNSCRDCGLGEMARLREVVRALLRIGRRDAHCM